MRSTTSLSGALGRGLLVLSIWACGSGVQDDGTDSVEATGSSGNATAVDPAGAGGGGASGHAGAVNAGGIATSGGGAGGTGGRSGTPGGAGGTGGSIAGTAGGAGNGGGGGAPVMHTIGACNGLQAIDQLENITPAAVDLSGNGITQVVLDAVHSGTLYVGTDKKGLFKSTNCGATWSKVNTGRNANILDSGTLWFVLLDPVDSQVMYASSLYGSDASLFKSTNGGLDWDSLFPKGSEIANTVDYNFFQWASMDPTDHQHLVVSFHANCKGPTGPECLAETKDSGATWRLFKGPLGGWGEGVGPAVLGATTWLLATAQEGVYFTKDSGASWEKVGPGLFEPLYHATNGVYYGGSDYGTQRSPDGHTWTLVPNAPRVFAIRGDGKRLFSSAREADPQSQQPYFTSPEGDGTKWTPFASPKMAHGAVKLVYDPDHHLLYSANTSSGLWRMVTQ